MSEPNYKIIEVSFSTRQVVRADVDNVTPGQAVDIATSDGIQVTGGRELITYLTAHISFEYLGQVGECVSDLQEVSTISFDSDGKYTSIQKTPIAYNSLEEVLESSTVVDAITASIKSIQIKMDSDNYTRSVLSTYQLYK